MKLVDLALPFQKTVIMDKSKVKVLNFSRQIGKSWIASFLSAKKCCQKKNSLVLYLSTGLRAANEALKNCLKFAEAIRQMSNKEISYTSSASCITFSNGSRIMSLPSSPQACRGWSADLLICDEMAFWQQPDECWQAIVPTILNPLKGVDKQILICSTPLGRNSLFYDLCQKAKVEPNWKYFQTTIHEAISDGLKVDLETLRKLIPDPYQFAQEFECQFADQTNGLVGIQDLQFYDGSDDCSDESEQNKFIDYFMGADWARSSDGTAIVVFGRTQSGKVKMVDMAVLHNIDYKRQIEVAKQMFLKWRPKAFYGDATGLGGPLMEQLNREVSPLIKPFVFNHQNKNRAYENFRRCVYDRRVSFKKEWKDQIVEDILLVQQVISDDGGISYQARRSGSSHADLVSAIILALQAEKDSSLSNGRIEAIPFSGVFGHQCGFERGFGGLQARCFDRII